VRRVIAAADAAAALHDRERALDRTLDLYDLLLARRAGDA